MPVMSGIEAAAEIRRIEKTRAIIKQLHEHPKQSPESSAEHPPSVQGRISKTPIIAVTANAMAGDRERFLANDIDNYIAKVLFPLIFA